MTPSLINVCCPGSGGTPVLRVVTREEPPYVMSCSSCSPSPQSVSSGNISDPVYQGFAIDLLDAISKVCVD